MSNWVDFRKLRECLDFVIVLQHYRVDFKRRGTQATAFCPLPGHQGQRRSPSFSVSFEKRIFQCFGCGAQGNVLDFISLMQGLDPRNAVEFRKAALFTQNTFAVGLPQQSERQSRRPVPPPQPNQPIPTHPQVAQSPAKLPVLINEPLDFELKNLDPKPQYLLNRGFTEATMTHFGLGYCTKGIFAGRVVIPLHDMQGRLIGYAGRIIFDEAVDEDNPKYLLPSKRERNGRILEFAKSLFVYNGHNIKGRVHDLIVVEGFPSVWWLWQHGFRDAVALMGSNCSVDQAKIIVNMVFRSGRVWFFTDGDKAGERCAESLFFDIGPHRFCKWVKLREGQPTDCGLQQLNELLAWKIET
jgi:DNA primase